MSRGSRRELERGYRPRFQDFNQNAPSLRTLLLAQAMREAARD